MRRPQLSVIDGGRTDPTIPPRCQDCRWHWRGVPSPYPGRDRCSHPELVEHRWNGEISLPCETLRAGMFDYGCRDMARAKCGESGRYFERRPPGFWRRLLSRITGRPA